MLAESIEFTFSCFFFFLRNSSLVVTVGDVYFHQKSRKNFIRSSLDAFLTPHCLESVFYC